MTRAELFEKFEALKDEIEGLYGSELDWYNGPGGTHTRRIYHSIDADVFNKELYANHFEWLLNQHDKLKYALEQVYDKH